MEGQKRSFFKTPVFIISFSLLVLFASIAVGGYLIFLRPMQAQPETLPESGGPDIMFISPQSGTFAEVGDTLAAHITANDTSGVARIDLWINGTLVMSQPSPDEAGVSPLTLYHWLDALQAGDYTLVARAYNTQGAMSESPVVSVRVQEQQGDKADIDLLYEAKEDDTLEKVAEMSGKSVADIQAANPGLQKLQPNQKIAIPHPPLPKPPAQPAMGGVLGGLQPQAVPGMGAIPGAQPQPGIGAIKKAQPVLNPNFGALMNNNPSPVKVPDGLRTQQQGCSVDLTWNDRSDNETGFAIYRRRIPDQAAAELIKIVGSNQTRYEDLVPYPATYEYAVEAMGPLKDIVPGQILPGGGQQALQGARSQPWRVEVKPDANCIRDPQAFKTIYLRIDDAYPKSADITHMALWFSINDGKAIRLPGNPNQYIGSNVKVNSTVFKFGLPTSVRLNPDQPIMVKFWAAGFTSQAWNARDKGPNDLGTAVVAHSVKDIQSKTAFPNMQFQKLEANGTEFKVRYEIALDEVKWDASKGDATCDFLPAPINLQVVDAAVNTRRIRWDYQKITDEVDFILYRSYSCVGQESRIEAPIFISGDKRSYDLDLRYEPQGCSFRYQIASIHSCGQSKRSSALVGDTEAGMAVLWPTFRELRIFKMPNGPQGAEIVLRAGYHSRKTDPMWLEPGVHKLDKFVLNGKMPNNWAYMVMAAKQTPDVFFAVSGVDMKGKANMGSICLGYFTLPPIETWGGAERTDTLLSDDGNCELVVDWKLQPPTPTGSGKTALPQADLLVDDMATIGNRVFARISNNGPDQLPGNQTYISFNCGEYRDMFGKIEKRYYCAYHAPPEFWIGFNTPVWVYLGEEISNTVLTLIKLPDRESWFFRLIINNEMWPDGKSKKLYIDPNPNNDWFFIDYRDVQPMK